MKNSWTTDTAPLIVWQIKVSELKLKHDRPEYEVGDIRQWVTLGSG